MNRNYGSCGMWNQAKGRIVYCFFWSSKKITYVSQESDSDIEFVWHCAMQLNEFYESYYVLMG